MSGQRQSRAVRRAGIMVRLTARDEELLRALARFGAVRTPDLVRLLFAGVRADTAARRLRKAFDAELVDVRAGDRARPNVYCLGPAGRRWAADHGVACARVPRGDIEHHLGVVAAWAGLAAACHAKSGVHLRRFVPDWELRKKATTSAALVIPDALVDMMAGDRCVRFALEYDRGGERSREWRRKIDGYRRWFDTQPEVVAVGLVVLAVGGRRRHAMLTELVDGVAAWTVVLCDTQVGQLLSRTLAASSPYAVPLPKGETGGTK